MKHIFLLYIVCYFLVIVEKLNIFKLEQRASRETVCNTRQNPQHVPDYHQIFTLAQIALGNESVKAETSKPYNLLII